MDMLTYRVIIFSKYKAGRKETNKKKKHTHLVHLRANEYFMVVNIASVSLCHLSYFISMP